MTLTGSGSVDVSDFDEVDGGYEAEGVDTSGFDGETDGDDDENGDY